MATIDDFGGPGQALDNPPLGGPSGWAKAVRDAIRNLEGGGVDTTALADGAVTSAKIANDTITAAQIAANAVGSSELADNAVNVAALDADDLGNGLVLTADSGEPSGMKWSAYGIADLDIGTVGTGTPAAASMTGNPEDGYELNLTLPPVGDGSISDIAIAADADIDRSKIGGLPEQMWADFTGKTDTTTFPTVADSGHAWTWPVKSPSPIRPIISGGRMTWEATSGGKATYLESDLGQTVSRIGADFSWAPGTGSSSIVLVVWTDPGVSAAITDPSPYIPDAPLHLLITPTHAYLEYYENSVQLLRSIPLIAPLATDHTIYRAEVVIDGDSLTAYLPDGQIVQASDVFVGANPGQWACWELFASDASGPAPEFARVWADGKVGDQPAAHGTALAAQATRGGFPVATDSQPGAEWLTIGTSWSDVDATHFALTAPPPGPTGHLLITYSCPLLTTDTPAVLWGLSDGSQMYGIVQAVNSAGSTTVTVQTTVTIPEGTPVKWQHSRNGAGTAYATLNSSAGQVACLSMIPI